MYKCQDCGHVQTYEQKASDDFIRECPKCKGDNYFIENANCGVTTMVGFVRGKTMGTVAEKNYEKGVKEGRIAPKPKKKRPWYRKSDKVNMNILKNPQKYIEEGHV